MGWWGWGMDVDLGADLRSGGTAAGRRGEQAVQEIIMRSQRACELSC